VAHVDWRVLLGSIVFRAVPHQPGWRGGDRGAAADVRRRDVARRIGSNVLAYGATTARPYRAPRRPDTTDSQAHSAVDGIRFEDHGRSIDLYDYLSTNRVSGLLVLKDGEIVLEDYELGIGPDTRWASFSIAKSIASTLLGAALLDGSISSLDDQVVRYVPACEGVPMRESVSARCSP